MAAWGWAHPAWHGAFYPEDLPEAWQLAYYLREFQALVLPSETWWSAPADVWAQWRAEFAEVEGARLFWGLPHTAGALAQLIPRLAEGGAGPPLDGPWLLERPPERPLPAAIGGAVYALFPQDDATRYRPVWRPGRDASPCDLGVIEAHECPATPRGLSDCLQAFLRQAPAERASTLILKGDPPSISGLRHLIQLAELLGAT